MRKILMILLILLLTGCNNKSVVNNDIENEFVPTVPVEIIKEEPKYVDTNPIKISAYKSNGYNYVKSNEVISQYVMFQDWTVFNVFYCDDDSLPLNGVANVYDSCKSRYENVNEYKTGFNVTFTYGDDNNVFNQTSKGVEDWLECNGYLLIYFYDGVYHRNDNWYSHTTVNEWNNNSNITAIKITGGDYTALINSDITITIFTYKDDNDFDENGIYRGNSKFTYTIKKA